MATISNNDIAKAIYLVLKDQNNLVVGLPNGSPTTKYAKVVKFLFRRRMLSKAGDILSRLKKIINHEEGRLEVRVSSVEKLNHQNKTNLEHLLKKRYGAKEIMFTENLDQKLVGGIKVEVNDEVIDLSMKNKIEKLQEYLIRNHE